MNCVKCGASVEVNQNFCRVCGTQIVNSNSANFYYSPVNNHAREDDMLLDAYINKNTEKIKSKKFSWPAFLFGPLYVLYRKMWVPGLILMIFNTLMNKALPSQYSIISIFVYIIVGIEFNKYYLKYAQEKIDDIKRSNTNLSLLELQKKCKDAGGTTIVPIAIFSGIILLLIMIIIFAMIFTAVTDGNSHWDYNDSSFTEMSIIINK